MGLSVIKILGPDLSLNVFFATVFSAAAVALVGALAIRGGLPIAAVLGLLGTFGGASFGAWLAVRNAAFIEDRRRAIAMLHQRERLAHAIFDIDTRYGIGCSEGDALDLGTLELFVANRKRLMDKHRAMLSDVRSTLSEPTFDMIEAIHNMLAAFEETTERMDSARVSGQGDLVEATRIYNLSHNAIRTAAFQAVGMLGRPDLAVPHD